jgi:hypothetical protein
MLEEDRKESRRMDGWGIDTHRWIDEWMEALMD